MSRHKMKGRQYERCTRCRAPKNEATCESRDGGGCADLSGMACRGRGMVCCLHAEESLARVRRRAAVAFGMACEALGQGLEGQRAEQAAGR